MDVVCLIPYGRTMVVNVPSLTKTIAIDTLSLLKRAGGVVLNDPRVVEQPARLEYKWSGSYYRGLPAFTLDGVSLPVGAGE